MADVKIVERPEEIASYSDDALFNINSWGVDLPFRELITMYDENELVKPELQRKYVWDKEEASRFVESILLGLPVPSIFLAKVGKRQRLIIDGYQRIMTIYDYVKRGVFSGDKPDEKKPFELSNSINKRWCGKSFADLSPDDQSAIKTYPIHAIIFEQKYPHDDTGMYQIFERINSSGQEIRNCIYQGKFNTFLMDLNHNPDWRELFGSPEEDSRMADVELILRFFAMMNLCREKNITVRQIALRKYLNEYMDKMNHASTETLEKYRGLFENSMKLISCTVGKSAFHNLTKATEQKPVQRYAAAFHPAIFDAIGQAAIYLIEAGRTTDNHINGSHTPVDYESRHRALLNNPEFKKCISIRTTNVDRIKKRIALALSELFGVDMPL